MKITQSLFRIILCMAGVAAGLNSASALPQDPVIEKFNTRNIKKHYIVKDKSGVKERKLWVTADMGATWEPAGTVEWGEDSEGHLFFIFRAPADGRYGLFLQFSDQVSNATPAPMPGEKPRYVAEVMATKTDPMVETLPASTPVIVEPRSGSSWIGGRTVRIEWVTPENGLKPDSAALYYSVDNGPWHLITKGLPASGHYFWAPPAQEIPALRLKVTVMTVHNQEIGSRPSASIPVHVQIKPDISSAKRSFHKATLLRAQRNWADAVLHYEQALALWPNYSDAMSDLGLTYYEDKRYPKALEFFLKAIDMAPTQSTIYINAGYAFLKLGLADDAVEKFRDAIEIGVANKAVALELGDSMWPVAEWYDRQNQTDRAGSVCDLILKLEHARKSVRKKAEEYLNSHKIH